MNESRAASRVLSSNAPRELIFAQLAHEMGRSSDMARISRKLNESSRRIFAGASVKLEELAEGTRAGKVADYLIRLRICWPNFPKVNVLPIIEPARAARNQVHITFGASSAWPPRTCARRDHRTGWREPRPPRLRVFSQQIV